MCKYILLPAVGVVEESVLVVEVGGFLRRWKRKLEERTKILLMCYSIGLRLQYQTKYIPVRRLKSYPKGKKSESGQELEWE